MKAARRFALVAGMIAAILCSSALEAAAQPEPILGCVKPGTGLLRIPPVGEPCRPEETPLGFNDLPLLVNLRNRIVTLEGEVQSLLERVATLESCTASIPACSPE